MKFLKYVLAVALGTVMGFFLCIIIAVGAVSLIVAGVNKSSKSSQSTAIEKESFLVLELNKPIKEKKDQFSLFFGGGLATPTLRDYTNIIQLASEDKDIKGIYLKLSNINMGWSSLKTIRQALQKFKQSKKMLIAHSDYYDEKSYYLASVANKVFMHAEGEFVWDGIGANPMFYKGLFDKLGVTPIVFRVGKYKSAIEPLIQKAMSPENKNQVNELIDDIWQDVIATVSKSRKLSEETIDEISEALLVRSADEALEAKLVDGFATQSEIIEKDLIQKEADKIKEKDFKKLVSVESYMFLNKSDLGFKKSLFSSDKSEETSGPSIAIIVIEGAIMPGSDNEDTVGADDVIAKILKAKYDKNIKGVVLRINSPGGSALASDVIWSEVKKLREVKPVYASFGDVAASGGYYIGVAAEKIFAHANTITGSIGVYSVLFNIEKGANDKLGLNFDRVVTHPFADRGSSSRVMTPEEAKFFQEDTNRVYNRFIEVVQSGREYNKYDDVHRIAQGRVWSGYQAKQVGLIDEIGNLEAAIASLASHLKLKDDYKIIELRSDADLEMILGSFIHSNPLGQYMKASFPDWAPIFAKSLRPNSSLLKERVWAMAPTLIIE